MLLSPLLSLIHEREDNIKSNERQFRLQGKFVITADSFFFEAIKKGKQWRKRSRVSS